MFVETNTMFQPASATQFDLDATANNLSMSTRLPRRS